MSFKDKFNLGSLKVKSFVTTPSNDKQKALNGGITGGCQETVLAVCGGTYYPCEVTNGPGCPLTEVGCSGTCTRAPLTCP